MMWQTLSNLTTLPHRIKTAVPNWFRRRSFAEVNLSVWFGTWVERRLNQALISYANQDCYTIIQTAFQKSTDFSVQIDLYKFPVCCALYSTLNVWS